MCNVSVQTGRKRHQKKTVKGTWLLLLHCHLPFVRHRERDGVVEENWLFEAVTETYLPLIECFNRLAERGIDFHITVSLSPTLCEMLADRLLQDRCARYIEKRLELCGKEMGRLRHTGFQRIVDFYRKRYSHQLETYGRQCGEAVLQGFRVLKDSGSVELITCAATHALLPLCNSAVSAAAQIEQGCRCFENHFGERPEGFWLPECAYSEDLVPLLLDAGISYSFLESHGALLADPSPACGVFAPLSTSGGLTFFARDPRSSKQVWSGDEGFPADPIYREFHRDAGFEAPYEYIRPYLNPAGDRHPLGLKYHRITGGMSEKLPYDPDIAKEKAREHAFLFVRQRNKQVEELSDYLGGTAPVIVSPYDGELFGHWWFEGPWFLETVLQETAAGWSRVQTGTPSDYLRDTKKVQVSRPAPSSWGYQGHYDIWINGQNDWIYRHLKMAEEKMVQIAGSFHRAGGLRRRALKQCIRELMLAQSSDWPFLISTDSAVRYAKERLDTHLSNFWKLAGWLEAGTVEREGLREMEESHNIFNEIESDIYGKTRHP